MKQIKIRLKNFIVPLLFCLVANSLFGQSNAQNDTPIKIGYRVYETVKSKPNSDVKRVFWLQDTITVGIQHETIKIDSTYINRYRRAFKDSTLYRTQEDIDKFIRFVKTSGQNCYSYAFEKYFENNSDFNQNLFGNSTSIDRISAEKILKNYFIATDEFLTKPAKNLKRIIPNNVLLAFVNNKDWSIHLVYYNDKTFYSKNGAFKPIQFQSLKKFLKKRYWDTVKIRIYKINDVKVRDVIGGII
ncbi:MAG: hypothetical protein ACON5F_10030 [Jejuia sp.]